MTDAIRASDIDRLWITTLSWYSRSYVQIRRSMFCLSTQSGTSIAWATAWIVTCTVTHTYKHNPFNQPTKHRLKNQQNGGQLVSQK